MEAVYVSNNSFSVVGSRIADFIAGRRVKIDCGIDGTIYAVVLSSTFTAVTTVVIDETSLTSNLTSVLYSPVKPGIEGNMPNHFHSMDEGDGGYTEPEIPTTSGTENMYLKSTGSGVEWEGVGSFTELLDTPSTYSGTEGFYVQSTGSGISFSFMPKVYTLDSTPSYDYVASIGDIAVDISESSVIKKNRINDSSDVVYTAKSIVLDIADNYGSALLAIRSVDFYSDGVLIPNINSTNFVAYASSVYNSSYAAYKAFDTSFSKLGGEGDGQWVTAKRHPTTERLICVFNEEQSFDSIIINNAHNNTSGTNYGAKNVKLYTSPDAITSTVYDSAISNSTLIFDGVFDEHVAANVVDNQVLTLTPAAGYLPDSGWDVVLDVRNNFTELLDTPTTYLGTDGKFVQSTGDGVTFTSMSGTLSLLDLKDTPSTFSGTEGMCVQSTGLGIEFTTPLNTIYSDTTLPELSTPGVLNDYYLTEGSGLVYKKFRVIPDSGYASKSIIIDIADGHGAAYLSIRSIEFYFGGSLLTKLSTDITAYASSSHASSSPVKAFDTSYSKIGGEANQWIASAGNTTNQRLICVFNDSTLFDSIIINNAHNYGADTNYGAKNVKIYTSADEIISTVYNEVMPNSALIFDGSFDQHSLVDEVDDQILVLIPSDVEDLGWDIVLETKNNFTELNDTPVTYLEGQYLRTTTSGIEAIDGIILRAPNDSEWLISVTNSGTLYTTGV